MERQLFTSFVYNSGWQAINRRTLEWQRSMDGALIRAGDHHPDLPFISGYDPDRPIPRAAAQLDVLKWSWLA